MRTTPLDITTFCPLAAQLAARVRDEAEELTARWLERIASRVSLDRQRIFPTDELLDHVPLLLLGVADYMEDPSHEMHGDAPVIAKAMELGELRFAQGFHAYEILKEYELLGGIMYAFIAREADFLDEPCTRAELVICTHRVFRALSIIQQATTVHFLQQTESRVREREERLLAFNRALTHEFKNQLHAATGAASLLEMDGVGDADRVRLASVISRSMGEMRSRMEALLDLTRIESDGHGHQGVLLPRAAAEAARALRQLAVARGVELRLADDLPSVEVHAAAVELCLTNYLSNAIKYSDPRRPVRWAEVRGRIEQWGDGRRELVVEVADNGLGVPADARPRLFGRFMRAHEAVSGVEGTGLGLSIVHDTVRALGGRAWAEFPEQGSVFAFGLPVE